MGIRLSFPSLGYVIFDASYEAWFMLPDGCQSHYQHGRKKHAGVNASSSPLTIK